MLTERVRRNPYSIVLFDEIEKAHPDVFNLLLQILDDGSLTDAQGRRVDFKNTLVVMTSNLGSEQGTKSAPLGFFSADDERSRLRENEKSIKNALKRAFRPEFLNRVDEIVIFNSLTRGDIEKICSIMLDSLKKRLEKLGIWLCFDSSVITKISDEAYDGISGARRLRRVIRRLIEDPLSSKLIAKQIYPSDKIRVTLVDGKIEFVK